MRIGRLVPVALSAVSLVAAPVAAQAAGGAPSVQTRSASQTDNSEHLSSANLQLVIALLAVTVGVIALVHNHSGGPATPVSP
jgi:hypothetical protein